MKTKLIFIFSVVCFVSAAQTPEHLSDVRGFCIEAPQP